MIAMRRNCLDPAEMQQVLGGELSKEEFDSAILHLDGCETCRTAAETLQEQLSGNPDSTDEDADPLRNETACQVALQNLLESSSVSASAAHSDPPPFETLGPYRLLELIGSGGMGAVYRAEHQRLKRHCAIKLLPPERVTQTGWLERFDREMTTIASLEHPHIVRANDAGHESGWHYLVMEHLDGLDIGRVASRMGQLDIADACEIVRQAALGLAHIHESGLVHRDIKPSNLMLTTSGSVKLLDLGLVLDGDDPLSKDDRLTTVGHVMGTMPYMAPEQLADSRDVRPQSDIYSLGATLYRLIAGHPPHRSGRGLAAQVLAITGQDAKPLDAVREDVDRDVVALVAKMLSRDPSKRPASALEVARQLESAAKPHRLKRLIRDAIRKRNPDEIQRSGLIPSVANGAAAGGSGGRSGIKRWLIGFGGAACLLVAAMVIKIQTDRGELVIHSAQNDLTVLVKQGDKTVDQLTIESGTDNRITLYKGTYEVEIQGGGNALALSDNVVTIGRGTEQSIKVVEQSSEAEIASGDSMAASATAESEFGGGGSSESIAGEEGGGGFAMMSGSAMDVARYNGKTLREWLTEIENESDVEKLGNATFSAIGALQNASSRGFGSSNAQERLNTIKAILRRAREFGGVQSKLPPLPGTSNAAISQSQHFMWYLNEVFAEPDMKTWYETSVDELVVGNTNSRAAMIYCLARHQQSLGLPNGYGGGDMGGMESEYGMEGGGSGNVTNKFTTSRLLRCCVSLASPDAWSELPPEQQSVAAAMARDIAIYIPHSIGITPESIPELVESIRSVPEGERTKHEIQVLAGADGGGTGGLRGMDFEEMMGGGEMDLGMEMDMGMTEMDMGSGVSPKEAETPNPVVTLFQGRDLSVWLDALERERDVTSIGEAMTAVEMLSREAGDEVRLAAAVKTMLVARRLGGVIASTEEDPSRRFMNVFPEIFSRYMPAPGLEAISNELDRGNVKSKSASLWVLSRYFDYNYSGRQATNASVWVASVIDSEDRVKKLRELRTAILDVADSLEKADPSEDFSSANQSVAASMARGAAICLTMMMGDPVAADQRLRNYVVDMITQSSTPKRSRLRGTKLAAAIQITEQDTTIGTPECWDHLAVCLAFISKSWGPLGGPHEADQLRTSFEAIKRAAPKSLLMKIHQSISQISPISRVGRLISPSISLDGQRMSFLLLAFPFYASEFEPVDEAAELLNRFATYYHKRGRPMTDDFTQVLKDAQVTLSSRLDTKEHDGE